MVLNNNFDTLEFSTTDFYMADTELFRENKVLAGDQPDKKTVFIYHVKNRRYFTEKYLKGEKQTNIYDLGGTQTFIMHSKGFLGYAWKFTDVDERYQFACTWSDSGLAFRKVFNIKIYAKTFMTMTYEEILEDLQEKIKIFGIDLSMMKTKRIDWATDLKFGYKKTLWFLKDDNLLGGCFAKYATEKKPAVFKNHTKMYGQIKVNEGVTVGGKSVKFRGYDKVLEAIVMYKDHPEKSELILSRYYHRDFVVINPEVYPEPTHRNCMDLDLYLDCLLRDYIRDKFQVLRMEYQITQTALNRKFKYVKDITPEAVQAFVYHLFINHTGIKKDYWDRDIKRYVAALQSEHTCNNKYEKILSTVQGRTISAVRRIGAGLAALGICMSEKKQKIVSFNETTQFLNYFKTFMEFNYMEKMWIENKVAFSRKALKDGSMDYGYFINELFNYNINDSTDKSQFYPLVGKIQEVISSQKYEQLSF